MDANIWTTIGVGTVSALIGTYFGTIFLAKKQENKIAKVRDIAIKGLKVIKAYAKDKVNYSVASSDFNNKLNIAEKRAILVTLHKLGLPIEFPEKELFNIKNIKLGEKPIDANEIDDMILQIEKGHCDNLFFTEVDSYFSANIRVKNVRNIAKRYVNEVFTNSERIHTGTADIVQFPNNWFENFTHGEKLNISVFRDMICNIEYFDEKGKPIIEKLNKLCKEIEVGLWDNYLFWDYNTYTNVISQNKVNSALIQQLSVLFNNTTNNTIQPINPINTDINSPVK